MSIMATKILKNSNRNDYMPVAASITPTQSKKLVMLVCFKRLSPLKKARIILAIIQLILFSD